MKIQILSDLHNEFTPHTYQETDCDVVVLAGDIDTKAAGVKWAIEHIPKPVIYVPGNHEYWGGSLGNTLRKLQAAAQGSNVHVLDYAHQVQISGVTFVGATMWTDFNLRGSQPLSMLDAENMMRDYKKVRKENYSRLHASDLLKEHTKSRSTLAQVLLDDPAPAGKRVVVTHHAPSPMSLHPRYHDRPSNLDASYASDLHHLMGPGVDLWIHGHTHDSFDYDAGGTRVVCNPRGYAPNHLNAEFNPTLTVEV